MENLEIQPRRYCLFGGRFWVRRLDDRKEYEVVRFVDNADGLAE